MFRKLFDSFEIECNVREEKKKTELLVSNGLYVVRREEMAKAGRPKADYYEIVSVFIEHIPKWKRMGRTDSWIAKKLGIGVTTLKKWKNEHKEFRGAFDLGRQELLENLESSYYGLALGKTRKKKKYHIDETGEIMDGVVEIEETEVQSETALARCLAQMNPEKWSKRVIEGDTIEKSDDKVIFGGDDEL